MDFNLTREQNNVKNENLSEEGIVKFIVEHIFHPNIESISMTKCLSSILETDGSRPPKHVQINSKYVKLALKYSINCLKNAKDRKINVYSELLIINIFMSDYALAWDLRKDADDLKFDKETLVIKTVSLVAPKSSELWMYYKFLTKKIGNDGNSCQIFDWDHYDKIVGSHFSNYYLHNSSVLQNIDMTFDQHAELVKKHVSDGSVVLRFCKRWCDRDNYARCTSVIDDLILIYDQGLESLWRGRQFLMKNAPDRTNSSKLVLEFLQKALHKNVSKTQLSLISIFVNAFQNSLC